MFRTLRLTLAVVLIASFASATSAGGGDAWSIVRVTGQIWIQADGAQTVALGDTRTVASGQTLATSANGRVLLQRGEETMVVGPSTVMRLPREFGPLLHDRARSGGRDRVRRREAERQALRRQDVVSRGRGQRHAFRRPRRRGRRLRSRRARGRRGRGATDRAKSGSCCPARGPMSPTKACAYSDAPIAPTSGRPAEPRRPPPRDAG